MVVFLRKYYLTIIWSAIILVLSLKKIDTADVPSFFYFSYADKLVHFLMYAILGAALCYEKRATLAIQWIFVFSFPIFFGMLIELLQTFTIYRSGDLWDALANVLGSLFGIFVCFVFKNKEEKVSISSSVCQIRRRNKKV